MSRQPVNGGLSEHSMQAAVIDWALLQAPSLPALAAMFAVPNGARVVPSVAARLKREGMRAGVPDLIVPVPAGEFIGLTIEMKTADGWVGHDQKAWHSMLRAVGHRVEVCRSIESACAVLREYALEWEKRANGAERAALLSLWMQYRESQKKAAIAKLKERRPVAAGRQVPLAGRVKKV